MLDRIPVTSQWLFVGAVCILELCEFFGSIMIMEECSLDGNRASTVDLQQERKSMLVVRGKT